MQIMLNGECATFEDIIIAGYELAAYGRKMLESKGERLAEDENILSGKIDRPQLIDVDFQIGYGLLDTQEIEQEEEIPLFTPHENQLALIDAPE